MIGAFQKNAFQNNAFQVDGVTTRGGTGGIYWKPEKDYEWPDLPGDVLSAVHSAVRELSGAGVPTVAKVVASVQPLPFAMPVPAVDVTELAAMLRKAAEIAIEQWLAEEDDDEEAILALLH